MGDAVASAWASARHAIELVLEDVVSVAPGWFAAGVLLHLLHQVVRTRGWFNCIRAAYPRASGLRARDVTLAYLAGSGLNAVIPARGGDVAKLCLLRRRAPDTHWSTLAATLVPESLFETAVAAALLTWAFSQGFLPVPAVPGELPALEVSTAIRHPLPTGACAVAVGLACVVGWRFVRRRARHLVARLSRGLAVLRTPRSYVVGVVTWQALGRLIRLGSIAAFMAAFALPVSAATVVLVMTAQSGGRIIPSAPASVGLRIALLTYGFVALTGDAVDIARITAFSFGIGAALTVTGLVIAAVILGCELGTASPRELVRRVRRMPHAESYPASAQASGAAVEAAGEAAQAVTAQ